MRAVFTTMVGWFIENGSLLSDINMILRVKLLT